MPSAALMPDPDGYLVMCYDGPLADLGNVPTLTGSAAGRFVIPREMFGWPLPDRIGAALVGWERDYTPVAYPFEEKTEERAVAIWNADEPGGVNLPRAVTESEHVVVYAKESESQMTEEEADHPNLIRGAAYRLETTT